MKDHPDIQAIAAVRGGDTDRFRELIERYERHVYAVAWSRLGDATLAEDVVQESFIRAYRLLGWLRQPERFAGWITRIARAVSINLGLRYRRELRRRERWALDPATSSPEAVESSDSEAAGGASEIPDEALRAALGDLPSRHREALVLFYLEGRTILEAATSLGITENAFKVRLHRARRALRGRLERRLEGALGRLGPRRSLAPGIMASIAVKTAASDPTGVAPGILAVMGAGLAKLIPFPVLFLLVPVGAVLAGFGFRKWATDAESRNYRDESGFRRRLYHENRSRRQSRGAVMGLLAVLAVGIGSAFPEGLSYLMAVLGILLGPALVSEIRQIRLTGQVSGPAGMAVTTLALLMTFGVTTLWNLPQWFLGLVWAIHFVAMIFLPPMSRVRMDENLFLRQRLGLLPNSGATGNDGEVSPLSTAGLRAFARFGAREGVFSACRKAAGGLRLALSPVVSGWREDFGNWLFRYDSHLTIHESGGVEAALGRRDAYELDRLGLGWAEEPSVEASQVERAVRRALASFTGGDQVGTLRWLGHLPEGEIFRMDPARTGHARLQRWAGVAGLALSAWMIATPFVFRRDDWREARWEAATLSVEDARARFELLGRERGSRSRHRFDGVLSALGSGYVLPPLEWLSPEANEFLRTNGAPADVTRLVPDPDRILGALWSWQDAKAFVQGWERLPRTGVFGLPTADLREGLARRSARQQAELLAPEVGRGATTEHARLWLEPVRWRVATLKRLDLLGLFDTGPLVDLLKGRQVVPGAPIPSGCDPALDRWAWDGLFATGRGDPIEETYTVLSILDDLGALAAIDREACVEGILRLHLGRGLFGVLADWERSFSRKTGSRRGTPPAHVDASARNTFAGWDSLRILGALDRVSDLREWMFRVPKGSQTGELPKRNQGSAVWQVVEAVLLREHCAAARSEEFGKR